ncbi:PAS domain-containing protein [Reyranella soli]|nr:PAS domain-containing protein [Reyranella soli]
MRQYILQQNIELFRRQLAGPSDEATHRTLCMLLMSAERDLAYIIADEKGVQPRVSSRWVAGAFSGASERVAEYWRSVQNSAHPYLLLDPGPGLHIVDVNDAYAQATMTNRSAIAGRSLFEVFPDNPADPSADGVNNLFISLQIAAETGRPHEMAIQRYDVRDLRGNFVERHWQPINSPVYDDNGNLICLLHHVEDVTAEVQSRQHRLEQTAAITGPARTQGGANEI